MLISYRERLSARVPTRTAPLSRVDRPSAAVSRVGDSAASRPSHQQPSPARRHLADTVSLCGTN